MTPLETFLPRLLPQLPGCPQPTALQALLDSACDFSDRSRAVLVVTDPQTLVAGQAEYDYGLPSAVEAVQLKAAWIDQASLALPPAVVRVPDDGTVTGTPYAAMPTEEGDLRLYPTPDKGGGRLVARLAVRPTAGATQVMDVLYHRWREAIVAGAAFRLVLIPGQAFTNLEMAGVHERKFLQGVGRAAVEANRGGVNTPLFVRPARFL